MKKIFFKKIVYSFKESGFSLIEIVIYLAIFSMISVVVINSFIVVLSSFSTIRTNNDLSDSGTMIMERISREIRLAKNIDIANTSSDTLQLNSTDVSGNNIIIKFIKEGNALNIYKDGTLVGNLLTQNIIFNSISFNLFFTSNTEGVKIVINLEDSRSKINKNENFYDTVTLRGGY